MLCVFLAYENFQLDFRKLTLNLNYIDKVKWLSHLFLLPHWQGILIHSKVKDWTEAKFVLLIIYTASGLPCWYISILIVKIIV